jgi:low density lipoprotein-related protein 2
MPECGADEYTCKTGSCLPFRFRCDGSLDCGPGDESDEKNCEPCEHDIRYFRCGNENTGQCLPISLKCDGHNDCGDMSDEANCSTCILASSETF